MDAGSHPLEGRTLGNYLLRKVIDQGGVGLVFIAEHKFFGNRVAVKILKGGTDHEGADMSKRFFQEARATRAVDHPNVVKVLDFGQDETDGLLYLVMELLEGQSVASRLKQGPIEEQEAARIGALVADALGLAHQQGIVHRDIKPGNIFLCSNGQVKLLDFGLAKVKESIAKTQAGVVMGTPQYLAPEQVIQTQSVGPNTDVYGLGAVIFRMVTGRLPFQANTLYDLIQHHLTSAPPPPSQFARVSPEMEQILLACLEKDMNKRPSMTDLKERLRRISSGLTGGARAAQLRPEQATVVGVSVQNLSISAQHRVAELQGQAQGQAPRTPSGQQPVYRPTPSSGTPQLDVGGISPGGGIAYPPQQKPEPAPRSTAATLALVGIAAIIAGIVMGGVIWLFAR